MLFPGGGGHARGWLASACVLWGKLLPLPAPAAGAWLGAELCLSQHGEEGDVPGMVGSVLSHVHSSSVNGFQGCSM